MFKLIQQKLSNSGKIIETELQEIYSDSVIAHNTALEMSQMGGNSSWEIFYVKEIQMPITSPEEGF